MNAIGVIVVPEGLDPRARIAGLDGVHRQALALQAAGVQRLHLVGPGAAAWLPRANTAARLTLPVEASLPGTERDGLVVSADCTSHRNLASWLIQQAAAKRQLLRASQGDQAAFACPAAELPTLLQTLLEGRQPAATDLQLPAGFFLRPARSVSQCRDAMPQHLRSLVKSTGGVLDRWLMRPLSLQMTRLLAPSSVSPNQISILSLGLALLASWMLTWEGAYMGWWAGSLFVFMRIVDCVDGELARLRFQGSSFGAWLDTVGDGIGIATWILGVSLITDGGSLAALQLGLFGILGWVIVQVLQYAAVLRGGGIGSFQALEWGHRSSQKTLLERIASLLEPLLRIDFISCAYVVLVWAEAHMLLLQVHAVVSWFAALYFLTQLLRSRDAVNPSRENAAPSDTPGA